MKYKKVELTRDSIREAIDQELSFTEFLERKDPSGNYTGSNLDAFERQLAARGLEVNHKGTSVTLDAFYEESNRILFPEFIDRNIRLGLLMGKNAVKVEDLIYTTTGIDSGTYQNAIADMSKPPKLRKIGEGSKFPVVKITLNDKTIYLGKYGRKILATYEFRRRVKANVFAVLLQFIGMQIGKDMSDNAIKIVIDGTGNSDAAPTVNYTAPLDYDALVDFDLEFDPYESDIWVAPKAMVASILKMTEFKDPQVGFDYQRTGSWMTPLGNSLKRSSSSELSTTKMLGVDTRFTLEKVIEKGGTFTESDKIIDGQWDQIVISTVVGFAKTFKEAAKLLQPSG